MASALDSQASRGRRSAPRRLRWGLAAAALALVLAALGGGVRIYTAPITPWDAICALLEQQQYAAVYARFSAKLRQQLPLARFAGDAEELDQVEGVVTGCSSDWFATSYRYTLGSSAGPLPVLIQRAKAGDLRGSVSLAWDGGTWTLDAIDAGALGIAPQALVAVNTFCQEAIAGTYAETYGLLGKQAQKAQSAASYIAAAQLQDEAQGRVTSCQPIAFAGGATDTRSSLVLGIVRAARGQLQGAMTLALEAGAWRVTALEPDLIGFDMEPLAVAQRFCKDMATNNAEAIWKMTVRDDTYEMSPNQIVPVAELALEYQWTGCDFHLSTLQRVWLIGHD